MILLKDFHNLFGQWLQEKLNLEQKVPCCLWNEMHRTLDESGPFRQIIILQQIQSKNEFSNLKELNKMTTSHHKIIWWSGNYLNDEDIIDLLNYGANAIVSSKQDLHEILRAVEEVLDKGIYYNEIVNKALHHVCLRNKILSNRSENLNHSLDLREKKVIELRYSGKTSKEIADILFLSKKTIDKIFGDLYRRFECNNFFELLRVCENKLELNSVLRIRS